MFLKKLPPLADSGSNNNEYNNLNQNISKAKNKKTTKTIHKLLSVFITTAWGWKTHASQAICPAGLALALMYIAVLGFDNVTKGKYIFLCFYDSFRN